MPDKFKNKYRVHTFRLQKWDYSSNGYYFITICTQNRVHFFGEIENGKMILSQQGELAHKFWKEIPNHFSFIQLGEFVIMPNHIHGILIINHFDGYCDRDAINRISTIPPTISNTISPSINPSTINGGFTGIKNPMFHDNISRVIRWYKGRCSFEIRKIDINFKWQSLFHDHVIRDQKAFENISRYIINNPENWKEG